MARYAGKVTAMPSDSISDDGSGTVARGSSDAVLHREVDKRIQGTSISQGNSQAAKVSIVDGQYHIGIQCAPTSASQRRAAAYQPRTPYHRPTTMQTYGVMVARRARTATGALAATNDR